MSKDDDSDVGSYKSSREDQVAVDDDAAQAEANSDKIEVIRYSPEEEQKLLSESGEERKAGNQLFGRRNFEVAIQTYDRALSICPNYLDYETAVIRSNIAACHLKLQEWKEAIESASKGIACLDSLERLPDLPRQNKSDNDNKKADQGKSSSTDDNNGVVEEVDDKLATRMENLQRSGHTTQEVRALQTKLLMRRAKAKSELSGWADLQAADEDYRILLLPAMQATLSNSDRAIVIEATRRLAPRLTAARENEVAEMMGKLKGLGNSLLKPFGLSTDNFNFVKDENSGGYSMNFQQNPGE